MESLDLLGWLRQTCADYPFNLAGLFHREGTHTWPLVANSAKELEDKLIAGGHILALPKEPASLANIIEVSLAEFLIAAAQTVEGVATLRGTERGYPDLEFSGPALQNQFHAVDIKVARRNIGKRGPSRNTDSRITLYTGNTYFKHEDLPWPGNLRAFTDYRQHLDVIAIYTLNEDSLGRVENLELIVHEAWRIASKKRSSTTREYIGAVNDIESLREGRGEFATPAEFYKFWRAFEFRLSKQVQLQLRKALALKTREVERLTALQPPGS
jgi:Restriction endonuclease EcoRV